MDADPPLIAWTPSFEVGNATIDSQHRTLVGIINRLHAGVSAGWGPGTLEELLAELVDYTVYHFSFEEGLMERAGYPHLAPHKVEHRRFVEEVLHSRARFRSGGATAAVDLVAFLSDWLRSHILDRDRDVGVHLRRRKAKQSR